MTSFMQFVDFTHESVPHVPAVKGTLVALYATGSSTIEATAADIAKYQKAGAGVVLIDQTPSLSVFAAGIAHVAISDVESGAGTPESAAAALEERNAVGVIYTSYNELASVEDAVDSAGVGSLARYGVANYSWSLADAEAMLNDHPAWVYVQYGDPESNPDTVVPGSSVTLKQCNADIDVALASWASQFMPPPPDVTVPHVEGMHAVAASDAIKAAGLMVRVGPGFVASKANYVGSQTPAGGTKVARGSTVGIGAFYHELIKVPSVIGMRAVPALSALKAKGLVGRIGAGFNGNEVNVVGAQSPAPGAVVPPGSTVTLSHFTH